MSNLLLFPPPETPEVQAAPRIPDADERDRALDITRSFIVEAPAGSGKTALLIQRFLKLLASETVTDPAQVLAITFTRKATHEMRDRVLDQLEKARRGADSPSGIDQATRPLAEAALANDRRHGWGLLEHPDRLNITTIDALCTRLANSLPVLSGAGGLKPVEKAEDLYAEAARRTLFHLGGDDPQLDEALRSILLHRDGNLADCERLIAEMLGWRDQWGNLIPLAAGELTEDYLETVTRPRLNKALELAVCTALTRLQRIMPEPLLSRLSEFAAEMAHAEGYRGAISPIAVCQGRSQSPQDSAHDLEHWVALAHLLIKPSKPRDWRKGINARTLQFQILKHHQTELRSIIDEVSEVPGLLDALCALSNLPPLQYPEDQWLIAKALFRILSRALVELQLVFQARGECDFTYFSLAARQALSDPAALDDLSAFDLRHLLVDEMQDTSTSQYDLIRRLTQSFDGHSQTVFLVGDPKQSIYLFRQARVARFIETLHSARLGDVPLTPLYLAANFRSQANLVEAFNQTFSAVLSASPEDPESVRYRAAHATRAAAGGPAIAWHGSVIPGDADDTAAEHRLHTQRNAEEIRKLVDGWLARPQREGKPWRIAILGRNRSHLHAVSQAFDPAMYQAVDVVPLGERQEVLDLLSLTRALLHPADRTAWLALLRTPWCGLTLTDLHRLTGQDDASLSERSIMELMRERGALLSDDGIARLQPFWLVMDAALAQRGRIPLAQWVERTWRAFAAERFLDASERANAGRFFDLLQQLESQPDPVSIARLERRLQDLYATPANPGAPVQMMTIHGAKGLEWDFVAVPQLESRSGQNRNRLLSWVEIEFGDPEDESVAHGMIAPVQPKGKESHALNRWLRSIESAREAAERKRLFYVACTRAREELHLFAAPERKKTGEISSHPDSLLHAAWAAAAPHFAEVREEAEPEMLLQVAASLASVPSAARTIARIPLAASPASVPAREDIPAPWTFTRPEGSYEARAFGNAMHAMLEVVTQRIAAGASPEALSAELPTWSPRIGNLLRASGLAPEDIARATANILRSLTRTLADADGRWLLASHPQAASEVSFATPAGTIRLDRTFLAGPEPGSLGQTHLWIIDFKTGTHGAEGLDQFLAREREKYAPQLEAYGKHLAHAGRPLRLALFYPTLPKLLWWPFAEL